MKRPWIGGGLATQAAIVAAALVLIGLLWVGSLQALRANRDDMKARAAASIASEALIFADEISNHLAAVDRTLQRLEREWEADPHGFDLPPWRRRAVGLSDAALQLFIVDAGGIVRQATDSALIGKNMGDRGFFQNRAALPRDDGDMYIGDATPKADGAGWTLNLSRRLDAPDGSFAGVISVTYDLSDLVRYFGDAGLGAQGLIELVGEMDERLRAAVGGGAQPGEDIDGTPMWQALARTPDGIWTGPSAPDGMLRLHAFRELRDRKLDLVLAVPVDEAVRPAMEWEREALAFVGLTTMLVLILAGGLMLEARAANRRVAELANERALLTAAKADADAKSQRLEVTLAGMSDGVMMMDADLRLAEWNERFPELIGLPAAWRAACRWRKCCAPRPRRASSARSMSRRRSRPASPPSGGSATR
jgi:PAS domain-containing protein